MKNPATFLMQKAEVPARGDLLKGKKVLIAVATVLKVYLFK